MDSRGSYLLSVLLLAFLLTSCEESVSVENAYTPSIIISKDEFHKDAKELVSAITTLEFVSDAQGIALDLGKIPEHAIRDNDEIRILERYFAYNPNDDFYRIQYEKTGVYGGTFEKRVLEYHPGNTTMIRSRKGGRVQFEEVWTCITYDDIITWAQTGNAETDCYSYR